ncbi:MULTISPECIES: hypothetical protein [Mycobacteroides]|uniref:VG15 protein n=1 Tax=Mycobacteroides TaxID=670516 RepID=UPI00092763B0|nr:MULTISPECIES: hypothetical protein [Mycobacteroides]SIL90379.1 Uncharacterised protein [Mycobacteroides abscessus subsp. abscessus]SLC38697.1 Uncharacterised protein [Mycobacteroides abscessus subsp. abscessus]
MATEQKPKEPKAIPALAEWYASQHADEQDSIADQVAAGLGILWAILQFNDLDKTTASWLHATTLEIEKGYEASSQAAFEYVQAAKWSVHPEAPPLEKLNVSLPVADTQLKMRVTGPIEVKRKMPAPEPDAMAAGEKASTGAGVTAAVDGAREQVLAQVQAEYRRAVKDEAKALAQNPVRDRQWATLQKWEAELAELRAKGAPETSGRVRRLNELIAPVKESLGDYTPSGTAAAEVPKSSKRAKQEKRPESPQGGKAAIGYARVTDNDPCYFCAVLASQGAVYYSEDSFDRSNSLIREVKWTSNSDKGTRRAFLGDGPAKVHDNCRCTLRPVYREADKYDKRAKYFLDQWDKITDGLSGKEAMNRFRAEYVPPPPYSADVLDLKERKRIVADVRHNREALMSRGFAASSPQVKFLDRSIRKLEAI